MSLFPHDATYPPWFTPGKNTARLFIENANKGKHPTGWRLGPEGSQCGTCKHLIRKQWAGQKTWIKCSLFGDTNGPGTDIRAKWRGCENWEMPT